MDESVEELFQNYRTAGHSERGQMLGQLCSRMPTQGPAFEWIQSALEDNERKWFVADLFDRANCQVPRRLFQSMIRAAVYADDLGYNRRFVEPCVRCFGAEKTAQALLEYTKNGTNEEKVGAEAALYWCPKSRHVRRELRYWALQEFVANSDVQLRRGLVSSISLNRWAYPWQLRSLVRQARSIVQEHEDEDIRGWGEELESSARLERRIVGSLGLLSLVAVGALMLVVVGVQRCFAGF